MESEQCRLADADDGRSRPAGPRQEGLIAKSLRERVERRRDQRPDVVHDDDGRNRKGSERKLRNRREHDVRPQRAGERGEVPLPPGRPSGDALRPGRDANELHRTELGDVVDARRDDEREIRLRGERLDETDRVGADSALARLQVRRVDEHPERTPSPTAGRDRRALRGRSRGPPSLRSPRVMSDPRRACAESLVKSARASSRWRRPPSRRPMAFEDARRKLVYRRVRRAAPRPRTEAVPPPDRACTVACPISVTVRSRRRRESRRAVQAEQRPSVPGDEEGLQPRTFARRRRALVKSDGAGDDEGAIAVLAQPPADVDVLHVREVERLEPADRRERVAADEASAGTRAEDLRRPARGSAFRPASLSAGMPISSTSIPRLLTIDGLAA